MHDEAALRRLISRLRQDLLKLPEELKRFGELSRLQRQLGSDNPEFDTHEMEVTESWARRSIENAAYLVHALLLSAPMLTELHTAFKSSLPQDLLDHKWGRDDDGEEYYGYPAQMAIERFFDLGIAALGGVISAERLEIVDAICRGLGETIEGLAAKCQMPKPDREEPVKQLGFQLLKAAFPDTEPDGGIRFKLADGTSRKPDAAIPSLRLCVEFKFANDAAELSLRVDEIVADISAYGDPRYDLFRAVVYAPYDDASQQRLDELLRERMQNIYLRYEWKVFLAKGPGGRTRRKS